MKLDLYRLWYAHFLAHVTGAVSGLFYRGDIAKNLKVRAPKNLSCSSVKNKNSNPRDYDKCTIAEKGPKSFTRARKFVLGVARLREHDTSRAPS